MKKFCSPTPANLVTLLLMLLIIVLEVFEQTTAGPMAYQREAVASGEWWRMYTCNWVHFGVYHTAMNVAGLSAVGYLLFLGRHNFAWWISLLLLPWVVGVGLYAFSPNIDEYRGFSAAVYGILAVGLILELPHNKLINGVALVLLLGKILYEQMPNYDVDYLKDQIGVAVAIEAHLAGVLGGLVLGVCLLIGERVYRRKGVEPVAPE